MVNSLNEYGYARWFLNPLSIFGLYPASECSSLQFLLSGIKQCTNLETNDIIFLYCIFMGILSIFTMYLMAGEIFNNITFKVLTAFLFSTSPAVLGYTTWTIPLRGLFVVLAPLFVYFMLRTRKSLKYMPLFAVLLFFLFATHHLFYFFIPIIFVFIFLSFSYKINRMNPIKIPERFNLISVIFFPLAFSVPFVTGKFMETSSKYAPINESYVRYIGLPVIFAIGGLAYIIGKQKKLGEWFLLLSLVSITMFIYIETYMKWFVSILAVPLAGFGLINVIKLSKSIKRGSLLKFLTISLMLCLSFSAYYQFIHFIPKLEENKINERYIEESTYQAGLWMRAKIDDSSISNDRMFGNRISAISERAPVLVPHLTINQIYGFNELDISEFKLHPVTSEAFWFGGYEGPAVGEVTWDRINLMYLPYWKFSIKYFVENTRADGNVIWHHGMYPSKLLHYAYDEKDRVYENGKVRIWKL
jgi:hypothetical protein